MARDAIFGGIFSMEQEKEKKKLLLVAVSVGVFLVIIISAAILIFTPTRAGPGPAMASSRPIAAGTGSAALDNRPASLDASEMLRNADDLRGIQNPPAASVVQETALSVNGEKPPEAISPEQIEGSPSTVVTITVPKPTTAAVPDAPVEVPRAAARPAASAKPAAAVSAKPAIPAAKPAVSSSARPVTAQIKHNDFWVQTGAFTARVRAEGVKETLASKGITSIIENRDLNGTTWYRVRVGPYTSETEANYWLALVKSIDGFADSQVRQSTSAR